MEEIIKLMLVQLLKDMFDDQLISCLCFDHFPLVYKRFAAGTSYITRIQWLINYCERYNEFDKLLTLMKATDPKQNAKFELSLEPPTLGRRVVIIFRDDSFNPEKRIAAVDAAVGAMAGVLDIPRHQINRSAYQVREYHLAT